MNLTTISRITTFAWQSFWRNIWLSVATISIIVLTLISINLLVVVNVVSNAAVKIINNKVDVSLYFRPDITEAQVQEVNTFLSALAQIKEISYISQQEALDNFRQLHKQDTVIIQSLEQLEENPIGATLQIRAKSIENYPAIMEILSNSKYNDLILDKNFDDHKSYIDKIQQISDNVKTVGLLASIVFILIAFLIVFNTIRVAIYPHREEIRVMKLVGATNWFIRSPFILEAVFYGIIACLLAIGVLYPFLNFVQPYINNFFLTEEFDLAAYFNNNFWQIFGTELLVIIMLNIAGSIIAIRRYLKV